MITSRSTAAIILAAGSSSRMGAGRHKLLLPLAGRPVLTHGIEATLASQARPIVIVLGHQAQQVRSIIDPFTKQSPITIVENPDYLQGMSTSMRVGLQTLLTSKTDQPPISQESPPHSQPFGSVLIVLGDQPLVTPQILDTLIATWRTTGKHIVAPLYEGKRGHPMLFDAYLFSELLEVTGDEGGRSIIERYRAELTTVEVGSAVANADVDTWEAYQQLLEMQQGGGLHEGSIKE